MAQQHDNEIDALLRAMAQRQQRGQSVQPEDGGADMAGHLDADELAAYVENSLPAAARERYMAHLAECSRCRSLVVELSNPALPVAQGAETVPVVSSPGFIDRIFSVFRLPALQYGMALVAAVLFVSSILIVVMRQRRADIALREAPAVSDDQAAEAPTGVVPQAQTQQEAQTPQEAPPQPDSSRVNELQASADTATQSPQPTPQAPPAAAIEDLARNSANSNELAKAKEQPALPNASPPKTTAEELSSKDGPVKKKDDAEDFVRQADSAALRASNSAKVEASRATPLKDARSSSPIAPASPSPQRESSRDKQSGGRAEITATAEPAKPSNLGYGAARKAAGISVKESDAETRSFQGRRFKRVGDIWTDEAYQKGQTLMEVRRNSDRSQVLLSREPGLRPYVEQFPGLLIVVWKKTAYKFY
jgi:hypothetical protein